MTTVLSHEAFHEDVGHAFNELKVLQQLADLPADSLLRVLQSIPSPLLRRALENQEGSQPASPAPAPAPPAAETAANDSQPRNSLRSKVLRGGKIIYNNRQSLIDAQVRDLSSGGCRVRLAEAVPLPRFFAMTISGVVGEKTCEVRWRSGCELGVRFI